MANVQQISIVKNARPRQLGQSRPSDTSAASIYSPASNTIGHIKSVFITETSGSAGTFRIFHDDDGTTYDQSTALYYDTAIAANSTTPISLDIFMSNPSGNLAIRSSSGNALTFTVYGEEIRG